MYSLVFIGIAAFLLALLATPLVRDFSRNHGALDQPDRRRKLHNCPVPRVGGVAVAIAYVGSFALLKVTQLHAGDLLSQSLPIAMRLLPAALLILVTGIADDLFGLKPWQKL